MKATRDSIMVWSRSSTSTRAALRRCRRLARHLPLPEPWSVEVLCAQVAATRSRPLRVLDREPSRDSITAVVFSGKVADYLFCREDLQGLHRDHAICHELGHILAGHLDLPEFAVDGPLFGQTLTFMRGCDYGADHEREAETIADIIMGRVVQHLTPRETPRQRVLRGLDDALG